eukprot:ctg_877.g370
MLGLLATIRSSKPDLSLLTHGIDLTRLGLNLNSQEPLYAAFASPFMEEGAAATAPTESADPYSVPAHRGNAGVRVLRLSARRDAGVRGDGVVQPRLAIPQGPAHVVLSHGAVGVVGARRRGQHAAGGGGERQRRRPIAVFRREPVGRETLYGHHLAGVVHAGPADRGRTARYGGGALTPSPSPLTLAAWWARRQRCPRDRPGATASAPASGRSLRRAAGAVFRATGRCRAVRSAAIAARPPANHPDRRTAARSGRRWAPAPWSRPRAWRWPAGRRWRASPRRRTACSPRTATGETRRPGRAAGRGRLRARVQMPARPLALGSAFLHNAAVVFGIGIVEEEESEAPTWTDTVIRRLVGVGEAARAQRVAGERLPAGGVLREDRSAGGVGDAEDGHAAQFVGDLVVAEFGAEACAALLAAARRGGQGGVWLTERVHQREQGGQAEHADEQPGTERRPPHAFVARAHGERGRGGRSSEEGVRV